MFLNIGNYIFNQDILDKKEKIYILTIFLKGTFSCFEQKTKMIIYQR